MCAECEMKEKREPCTKENDKSFDASTTHCEICGNLKTIQAEETGSKTYCWTCPPTN